MNRRNLTLFSAGLIGFAAALAGCKPTPPSGQVLATVNGKEITDRDVRAELAAAGVPENSDFRKIAPAALDRLIDRKLVATEAERAALDNTPDFLANSRRSDEILLGQQMLQRWGGELSEPSADAIKRYMAANGAMFADRALVVLEQYRLKPGSQIGMPDMQPLHSMADVAALLQARNIAFERGETVVDTAQVPREVSDQLRKYGNGEPLVEQAQTGLQISAVKEIRPAPLPPEAQRQLAVQRLKQQQIADKVRALRTSAKVDYQQGYAPPAKAEAQPKKK